MTVHPNLIALALFALCLGLTNTSFAECAQQRTDLKAQVRKVYDGDTLQLSDGTRIRIIGINAPEFGRRGRTDELLAQQAKSYLEDLLKKHNNKISLQYGPDKFDRYGRTLAHVFLEDGSNVATQLLTRGLAAKVVFPPNIWGQKCYLKSESRARSHNLGLWQHIVTPVEKISLDDKGFRIIEGKITRVADSKKSIWLNFNAHFAVRIARKDLEQFALVNFKQLQSKTIQVRGWVYGYKDKKIIRLRHSSMLEIMK